LFPVLLLLSVGLVGMADTIRLKDGSVLRGQVVGYKDQQFVVLLGSSDRGRRSRVTIYSDEVESIEFEPATSSNASVSPQDNVGDGGGSQTEPVRPAADTSSQTENVSRTSPPVNNVPASQTASSPIRPNPAFFQITSRVRGDDTANGWTNTGLVVRKGQRLRLVATGRVGLGAGRFSTASGLPTLPDGDKLMRNEATGALIAVVGDDNDEFILIGPRREFTAQRDGVLFLGVNEGNLRDNTGSYEVVVEAESMAGR
jgi:small nuclear ribonucleoprotein (snRNP)-like protein